MSLLISWNGARSIGSGRELMPAGQFACWWEEQVVAREAGAVFQDELWQPLAKKLQQGNFRLFALVGAESLRLVGPEGPWKGPWKNASVLLAVVRNTSQMKASGFGRQAKFCIACWKLGLTRTRRPWMVSQLFMLPFLRATYVW